MRLPPWLPRWAVWGAVALLAVWAGDAMVRGVSARATWHVRAAIADSTAKGEQRRRAAAEASARSALDANLVLGRAIDSLRAIARHSREVALGLEREASRYSTIRATWNARLAASRTAADSVPALVAALATADSLHRLEAARLARQEEEAAALAAAVERGEAARRVLAGSLDSARTELGRMGQVVQSLQASIRTAHPTAGPRLAKLAITASVGYCVSPSLTDGLCAQVGVGSALRLW